MAYKREDLEKKALEAIEKHNCMFINELIAYLPCTSATFYNYEFEKLETIKDALEKNRITTKNNLKAKWYRSSNATLQVALMKLICDDDERRKLSQSYSDITSDGEKLNISLVEFIGDDNEQEKD